MGTATARRYARAVFELAQEQQSVESWYRRLQQARDLLTNPEVAAYVDNPSLAAGRRMEILAAVMPTDMGDEGRNLLRLLVENGRVRDIDAIVEAYSQLADEAAGRVRATATTAVPLSDAERQQLEKDLASGVGREVRLEVKTDPAVLGGLVLQVGDQMIDASVAGRLRQLRRAVVAG